MKNLFIHKLFLLLLSIAGAVLTSCGSEDWATSTSDASAMTVQVPGALNLGTGDLVLSKP